jgi:hypothetical protein
MKPRVSIPKRIDEMPVNAINRKLALQNFLAAEASLDRAANALKQASRFVAAIRAGFASRQRSA